MSKLKIYIKSILIPVMAGTIVGLLTSGSMNYDGLLKPALSPPGIIFPIVWSILYTLMGISYGILDSNYLIDSDTNFTYYLQLIVNLLWSIFFFIFKWRFFSIIWIVLLLTLVILMIIKFYNKNKISGLLQIPYILWVSFATYLNISIYILNR